MAGTVIRYDSYSASNCRQPIAGFSFEGKPWIVIEDIGAEELKRLMEQLDRSEVAVGSAKGEIDIDMLMSSGLELDSWASLYHIYRYPMETDNELRLRLVVERSARNATKIHL